MLHNMAILLCFVAVLHLVWTQLVFVRQKYPMKGPLSGKKHGIAEHLGFENCHPDNFVRKPDDYRC